MIIFANCHIVIIRHAVSIYFEVFYVYSHAFAYILYLISYHISCIEKCKLFSDAAEDDRLAMMEAGQNALKVITVLHSFIHTKNKLI